MIQALVYAAQGGCRGRNPAFVDTGVDDIDQALVADVFVGGSGKHGFLPTEFLRVAETDALVEHFARHLGRSVLDLVPRATVIGVRRLEGFGSLEVDGDNEFSRLIRDFDVLGRKVDGRSVGNKKSAPTKGADGFWRYLETCRLNSSGR